MTEEKRLSSFNKEDEKALRFFVLEFFIYIAFCLSVITLTLSSTDKLLYYFSDAFLRHYVRRDTTTKYGLNVKFEEIITISDWWSYLENRFVRCLDDDYEVILKGVTERETMDSLMLGPPRLVQKRVVPAICQTDSLFRKHTLLCYHKYDDRHEDKSPQFKGTRYYSRDVLDGLDWSFNLAKYQGGGYVRNMAYDLDTNREIVKDLKVNKWLDRSTRLFLVEMSLYNDFKASFLNFKIVCEVSSTGGIEIDFYERIIRYHTFWNEPHNHFVQLALFVFYCCLIYYTIFYVRLFSKIGSWKYVTSISLLYESFLIVAYYACCFYHFWHAWTVNKILKSYKKNPNKFQSLSELTVYHDMYLNTFAVCTFLTCVKVFKYFKFNESFLHLGATMYLCSTDLFHCTLIFFIIFMLYSLSGFLQFSSDLEEFKNVKSSVLTTMKMIGGDVIYNVLSIKFPVLGPIFCFTFVFLIFFVVINIFMTIIAETYLLLKTEIAAGRIIIKSKEATAIFKCTQILRNALSRVTKKIKRKKIIKMDAFSGELFVRASDILQNYFQEVPSNEAIHFLDSEDSTQVRLNHELTHLEVAIKRMNDLATELLLKIEAETQETIV